MHFKHLLEEHSMQLIKELEQNIQIAAALR
jgi:hypothetical protein